jgi:uncharacterized lipoprotein YajG
MPTATTADIMPTATMRMGTTVCTTLITTGTRDMRGEVRVALVDRRARAMAAEPSRPG